MNGRNPVVIAAFLVAFAQCAVAFAADPPELASWKRNTTGATGYAGIAADVQRVRYSSGNVYVSCTDIPDNTIGPWAGNPNTPVDQAFVFRIPRSPAAATGARTPTPLGFIGVWSNGVVVFNALDARSYNNADVWHQNAVVVEADSFDQCLGHPAPGGTYHHHQNPRCLDTSPSTRHSPILGYAFDGFPIYGPYAFANVDGSGGVARMRSSYRLRNITTRTSLPGGFNLPSSQYGPAVSTQYPLGYYIEDYEYAAHFGDLDESNGRLAVTPEYPSGTWAYYVSIDDSGASAYPYVVGPNYHGVVATDNLTSHGKVTVSEPVTDYAPSSSSLFSGCCPWIVPAGANATGIGGSLWKTRLVIDNTGTTAASLSLYFLEANVDNSNAAAVPLSLPAGKSVSLEDVVQATFGVVGKSGAIGVDSDSTGIRVTSRTYNGGSACPGSFGQGIAAVRFSETFSIGESAWLAPVLADSSAFRTNLGVVNASPVAAALTATLVDADGVEKTRQQILMSPWSQVQVNDLLAKWQISLTGGDGRIALATSTPGAHFAAYLSVVDNLSGDPAYFPAMR